MKNRCNCFVGIYSLLIIGGFSVILAIPESRAVFGAFSGANPYIAGFIKFSLLATVGELIAGKMAFGEWFFPQYFAARAIIWGILGIVMTLAMKIFGAGIQQLLETGILPGGTGRFWKAFMTSFWCNLMFAPVMMCTHKFTDTYLELKQKGNLDIGLSELVDAINWKGFFGFTICRTIPFFWIPAHTITFMLPSEFQTIMAAYLSIALGIILNLKKKTVCSSEKVSL